MDPVVIKKKQQKSEKWPGGKTTELAIYPKGASCKGKDFIWRLSTATCKKDKSKFTSYEGYDRLLLNLDTEEVTLEHASEGEEARTVTLGELESDIFDGAEKTVAHGLKRDYNLIIKKDCKYKVEVVDQIQAGAGVNKDKSVPVGDKGEASFLSIDSIIKGKRVPLELAKEEGFDHVTQAIYCVDGFSSVHFEITDMSKVTRVEDAPVDIKILRLAEGEQLICDYRAGDMIKATIKGAGRLIHCQIFYND